MKNIKSQEDNHALDSLRRLCKQKIEMYDYLTNW